MQFQAISDRMCCLRLKGRFQKITLINVHAPTEKTDIEVKEEFYETLDKEYGKIKKYDLKIVLGDLNAKIGQEELFRPTIGKYSKHEVTNNNGQILIDFAREKDMIIKSTYFQKKEIHKGTWIAPDGKTVNQIDHVLIERMEERSITDVRSYRGPDLDTDHFLVGVKMKQIVPVAKNRKNQERKNLKTCIRLKNEEERKMYLEMVNDWVAGERQDTEDIEDLWLEVKNGIKKASSQSTQETGKENKNERWFDKECEEELEKRTTLRLKVLKNETEENLMAYKEQRKICKRLLREKKRKYKFKLLDEIEENYKNKEIRSMYQGLKQEKKGYQSSSVFYKNEKGELVGNEEKILELWQRYFDELLNGEENGGMIEENLNKEDIHGEEEEKAPSLREVKEIIKKLKNNKSPGEDQITAELLKYGGEKLEEKIQKLLEQIWLQEQMPQDWNEAILIPVHKKGDKMKCSNYRGIALLNVVYKILASYIKDQVIKKVEKEIGEYQGGFRANRSVVDQIFTLREIQAESFEYKKDTFVLFVDFKQAYDRIKRQKLYEALRELGMKNKLIKMIKLTLKDTDNRVRIKGKLSKKFKVKEGLRQGDPLSPILFNCALEYVVRKANLNRSGLLYHKSHQCLAFADDVAILTRSRTALHKAMVNLEEEAQKMGLQINEDKTKLMTWTEKEYDSLGELRVNTNTGKTYRFKEVETFTYLGTEFYRKPDMTREIQSRIMAGNRSIYAFRNIMNRNSSRGLKLRVYKTIIRPIVIFASETWTLGINTQKMLKIWERKVLRKIYGGKKTEDGWERRTNNELAELYHEPNIVAIVKGQRLRWFGHVMRMKEERVPKKILESGIGGKRRQGRPRTRWKEDVLKDIAEANIANWRKKLKNRKEWREAINQAMGQLGLEC